LTDVRTNISLKPYNTFGIDVKAFGFAEINRAEDISDILKDTSINKLPRLILGGGSNILFTKDFDGLVIKNNIKGIDIEKETGTEIWVKAASGVVWHQLVLYAIAHNYGGIENLSLIPGTVGAAPMQNIGAYGVELKDVFESLEAVNLKTGKIEVFEKEACRFGYRDSIFKQEGKDRYFILSVTLKLQKSPVVNTSYGAIQKLLDERGIAVPGIAEVSQAVCDIRNSKLPNPALIGNAGSFFKNPEIPVAQYHALQKLYHEIPGYTTPLGIKVPAGWLIESCGWKGKRIGETGSHKDQALVLVNYGNAHGDEVKKLATDIQKSVLEKFGVVLSTEVNIV
jgi:UDP-N-acetylmuramate dehydrogenase